MADGSGIGFSDGQTVSDLSAEDGAVIALYAQWLEGPVTVVTVTFKANDGTQTQSDQVMVSGVETSLAANPFSRDGYAFFSWNTQPDGGGTVYADREEVTLTDGLVLYAMWVPNTYTVHFDANGGTGTMRDQEFAYGASQKLFKNAFERVDHEFAGWSTNADGTGKQFTDQQEVVNLTADAGDTVTLYAKWN